MKDHTQKPTYRSIKQSGNMFFALFGAVGLVGVIGASAMSVMKGPVRSMHNVTQKTIAENNMIAAGKLGLIAATSQANDGDCDLDTSIEPIPFEAAGVGPKPTGGGYLPNAIGAAKQDPWGTTYGYCAWDHGAIIKNGTCPDDAGRLSGQADESGAVVALISAGPDRSFQTTCGNSPAYVVRSVGSDDIVLEYSYDEAGAMSGGLWTIKGGDPNTAEINKNLEVKDSGGSVVFGVDSTTIPAKPSIKVDFISGLDNPSVEFLDGITLPNANTNIAMGNNWLSGDGTNEGIRIDAEGDVGIAAAPTASMKFDVNGPVRFAAGGASYDVWIQGGNSIASSAARNLALLGQHTTDTLYLNHGSEYTNGVVIGGPTINSGNLTVNAGSLSVGGNITSTGRYYFFGPTQYLYGDNSSALYYNSNSATIAQMFYRNSAGTEYGRVYGNASDFGLMDRGGNWSYRAIAGGSTLFYVNGNNEMRLYPTYLDMLNNRIANVGAPTAAGDATSKTYVDNLVSTTAGNYLPLSGGTMSGNINMNASAITSNAGTIRDGGGGWVRTYGATGWYNGTYGGGMYMTDSSFVRTYNGKHLLVDASVRSPIFYDQDNTGYYMDAAGITRLNDLRPNIIYDGNNTGYYWDGNNTTSMNAVYANAYYYHSDERLKQNIATLGASKIDDLYKIRGVSFDWKESGKADIGFVAQELQKVFPELVDQNKEGIMGVKYGNVVALLVEAVKSQKSEIDSLKSEVASVRNNIAVAPDAVPAAPVAQSATTSSDAMAGPPKVDVATLPYADDISICVKPVVPSCLGDDMGNSVAKIDCNTEMTSYIYSAKIHGLCIRGDQAAHSSFAGEYDAALKSASGILFDAGDVALDSVMASHVIALKNILGGNAVTPAPVEPEALPVGEAPPVVTDTVTETTVATDAPAAVVDAPVAAPVSSAEALGIPADIAPEVPTAPVVAAEPAVEEVVTAEVSEEIPAAPVVMAPAPVAEHNHSLIYLLIALNFMFSIGLMVALLKKRK